MSAIAVHPLGGSRGETGRGATFSLSPTAILFIGVLEATRARFCARTWLLFVGRRQSDQVAAAFRADLVPFVSAAVVRLA